MDSCTWTHAHHSAVSGAWHFSYLISRIKSQVTLEKVANVQHTPCASFCVWETHSWKPNVKKRHGTWLKAATPPRSCVITRRRSGSERKCFPTHLRVSQSDQWIKDLEPSKVPTFGIQNKKKKKKTPAETRCRRTKPAKKKKKRKRAKQFVATVGAFHSSPLLSSPLHSALGGWAETATVPTVAVLMREGQQQEPTVFLTLKFLQSLLQRCIRHLFILFFMTCLLFPWLWHHFLPLTLESAEIPISVTHASLALCQIVLLLQKSRMTPRKSDRAEVEVKKIIKESSPGTGLE